MAIFSLNLKSIGRSTHEPGTAAAHLCYILREGACEDVVARGIPTKSAAAAAWISEQEAGDRANARICDNLILAMPCELTIKQMHDLLKEYCERMSNGTPYLAALHHPSGNDDRNWHAHLVFRDRCPVTGKRVMQTSERGAVEKFRITWEECANLALTQAGHDKRIDHRSLVDQGDDRLPQIHEGVAARAMAARNKPLVSKDKPVRNGVCAKTPCRTVRYTEFDNGSTRHQENAMRERERAILRFRQRVSDAHDAMAAGGFQPLASLRSNDPPFMSAHAWSTPAIALLVTPPKESARRMQRQRARREQSDWRTSDDFHAGIVQSASRPGGGRRRRSSRFEACNIKDAAAAPQGCMTISSDEGDRFVSYADRDRAVRTLRAGITDEAGIFPPRYGLIQPTPSAPASPMLDWTMHKQQQPNEPTNFAAKSSGRGGALQSQEYKEYLCKPTRRRDESTSAAIAFLRAELARMKVESTTFTRTQGSNHIRGLRFSLAQVSAALATLTSAQLREWEANERRAAEESAKHLATWQRMVAASKREANSPGLG